MKSWLENKLINGEYQNRSKELVLNWSSIKIIKMGSAPVDESGENALTSWKYNYFQMIILWYTDFYSEKIFNIKAFFVKLESIISEWIFVVCYNVTFRSVCVFESKIRISEIKRNRRWQYVQFLRNWEK